MKTLSHLFRTAALAAIITSATFLTGCLERNETIKVKPNGQVDVTLVIKADKTEELAIGRVPSRLSGWSVDTTEQPQDKKVVMTATQTFANGFNLPSNDADPGDPLAKAYIQFPTTINVEHRNNGTYYQFRRVYTSRPWAWLAWYDDRPGSKEARAVFSMPKDKVTDEQWKQAMDFATQTLVLKKLTMARDAQLRLKQHLPQDKWLTVAARVEAVADKLDRAPIIALLKTANSDPESQSHLARTVKTFETDLDNALREGLTAIGFTRSDIEAFNGMMNFSNAQNSAISDARASTFNIEVNLPGKLVGTNGKADETGMVKWQFNGEAFSDRDFELLATSVVPVH